MKPVYDPVPSLISFIISQLKINSLTYAQYMTLYQPMKLDIVFLVTMAIMYALTGFIESIKDIAELCRWSWSYLSVSSDCDVGDGSLWFQICYNISWGVRGGHHTDRRRGWAAIHCVHDIIAGKDTIRYLRRTPG